MCEQYKAVKVVCPMNRHLSWNQELKYHEYTDDIT